MNIKLAHFELLEEIGHGGLGIVFRAYDPSLNRNVAIKVLKDDFAQDPVFLENFLREARNAAAISHPHIAQVHFVGEHEGNYYLVMELVNGRSLEDIVRTDGPLPEAKALRVAIEIAEALKAGYVNQMIHGDIKPQNIVVGEECGAKLLDFGLAQLANVEVDSTGGIWGSPYYISPERVGRKAEDFRSDVYSLGATIFEALVGHPPFEAADPTELALKRLNEKPPLLRTLNPNISKRTEQIVDKMLHKNLLTRYLDYDSLLKELRKAETAVLSNKPLMDTMEMRRATGYMTVPIPIATPRSLLPTILAVSLASCLLVGGFFYFLLARKSESQAASPAAASPAVAVATPLPVATPKPAVQTPAPAKVAETKPAATVRPATPTASQSGSPFALGIKTSENLLAEFKTKEADTEVRKLVPAGRSEGEQITRIIRLVSGITSFVNQLKSDISKKGFPMPIEKRDGKRLEGGVSKLSDDGIIVSTAGGDVAVPFNEISITTFLAMNEYFNGKDTNSDIIARRNWNVGVMAIILGSKTEGKARMDAAIKANPTFQNAYDKDLELILTYTPDQSVGPAKIEAKAPVATPAAAPGTKKRIVYIGFDYPEAAKINAIPDSASDVGLVSGTWTGGGKIISPGLTYNGIKSIGNAIQINSNVSSFHGIEMSAIPPEYTQADPDAVMRIGKPGTTLWFRVLMRPDAADTTGTQVAGVNLNGASSGGVTKLSFGIPGNGNWSLFRGPLVVGSSKTPATVGTTALLVVRVKWGQGKKADEVDLFVNPPMGPNPPVTPDATLRDLELGTFDRVDFKGNRMTTVDEFSIATEWSGL